MRIRVLPAIAFLIVACSSAQRPAGLTKSDVDVRLMNSLFFSSAGTASANFEVTVQNTAKVPITIHAIRLSSPGMVQYSLRPEERRLLQTLDPGEETTVSMTATVFGQPGMDISTEPFAVRVFLDFEAEGKRHHDLYNILNVSQ